MRGNVVTAVVKDGRLIAVCEDGTAWEFVEGSQPKWEKLVRRIADFS